jgi:hypothetical protein
MWYLEIDLMATTIRTFEPVAGTLTHVLLDSWYSAKCLWRAAREGEFLITRGIREQSLACHGRPKRAQRLEVAASSPSTASLLAQCSHKVGYESSF